LIDPDFVMQALPGTPAPSVTNLDLQDTSNLTIRQRIADKSTINLSGAAAVVISLGGNGFGGQSVDGDALGAPVAGTDEAENTDDVDDIVITRERTGNAATGACNDAAGAQPFCEFDDVLMWIPESVLFSRLIQAGRLP